VLKAAVLTHARRGEETQAIDNPERQVYE